MSSSPTVETVAVARMGMAQAVRRTRIMHAFPTLSDIHFRKKDFVVLDTDPNAGLRDDLINDVRYMREFLGRSADAVLISGDIAFSGAREEYDFAFAWFESALCPAAGCAIQDVFVIPGNHDVDRGQAAAPLHQDARDRLREYPAAKVDAMLRAYMGDKTSAQLGGRLGQEGLLLRPPRTTEANIYAVLDTERLRATQSFGPNDA